MHRKTGLSPPVIITDRPKAVHSLRFHLFYVRCCQFLNVIILTLLCVLLFHLVKLTELPAWERLSSVISLFVKICLFIFPFDVYDKLWVLFRPVSEVYLLD